MKSVKYKMTKNKIIAKITRTVAAIKEDIKMITEMSIMKNMIRKAHEVARELAKDRNTRRNDIITIIRVIRVEMRAKVANNVNIDRNIIKKNQKRITKTKIRDITKETLLRVNSSNEFATRTKTPVANSSRVKSSPRDKKKWRRKRA